MANNIIIQKDKADDISVFNDSTLITSAATSLDFSADFSVSNIGNSVSISLPSTSNVNTLYRHNGGTIQTLSTSFLTIKFDTNIITDSDYTYSNGTVIFNRSGRYRISYDISINVSVGSNRSISETTINFNGTDSVGGRSYGYHRVTSKGHNSASASVILNVILFDSIQIQSRRISGSDTLVTLPNACRLTIERLS